MHMADVEAYQAVHSQLPPPRAPSSTPDAEGTPNVRHRTSGMPAGWQSTEKGRSQPPARIAQLPVPCRRSPARQWTTRGNLFHREMPVLWTTLCKNYSFI